MNQVYAKLQNCYECVRKKTDFVPKVAIVLGSVGICAGKTAYGVYYLS